jgi:hypothetical protein
MNTTEIEELIKSVPAWFHKIEVTPGIITPGVQDTEGLLNHIKLPDDLTGKRVLDIGARWTLQFRMRKTWSSRSYRARLHSTRYNWIQCCQTDFKFEC